MKRIIVILSALLTFLIFSSTSCEKEPFTTIKLIESQVHNEIKAHRVSQGIGGNFVHQPIMVIEAQRFSAQMAFAGKTVDTTGISVYWDAIHDKTANGSNDHSLVQSIISSSSAADIVKAWTDDPASDSLLLLDYTQCGVGVETSNGTAYVTLMMMLIEN